jgi:hypothetical protein
MAFSLPSNAQKDMKDPVLRHVVLFKFKDSATTDDIMKVCKAFEGLQNEIDEIKAFEWGENNSPEGLNQGLTHCFLADFESEGDRDAYLIHPAHKKFGSLLGPFLDKVTVVDYWKH